ncbi:MAG: DUF2993 domain-containing protein [Cyanobacterium sp. T60_A2020_053]|nr:DUF2993 domain-containing protein [Cyanobacterium sp. T60_A2020_053]
MSNHQKKSDLIARFLSPAIKLWVRSQLDSLEDFSIHIEAKDRDILKGKIKSVTIEAKQVIYKGICVNQALLNTINIEVNLGSILRGKPLKLLHPIYIVGEINLNEKDLQESLKSNLLTQGLTDFVKLLLQHEAIIETEIFNHNIKWNYINLEHNFITLNGNIIKTSSQEKSITIKTKLMIDNSQKLLFDSLYIEGIEEINNKTISNFVINLGNDVELEKLIIDKNHLLCSGKIKVVS